MIGHCRLFLREGNRDGRNNESTPRRLTNQKRTRAGGFREGDIVTVLSMGEYDVCEFVCVCMIHFFLFNYLTLDCSERRALGVGLRFAVVAVQFFEEHRQTERRLFSECFSE